MSQGFTKDYLVKATGETDVFVNGTLQATTSGTEYDFTVPSGITEFKLALNDVSFDANSELRVQLGDAGGIETTGYDSVASYIQGATTASVADTAGFDIANTGATLHWGGVYHFVLMDAATNLWACSAVIGTGDGTVTAAFISGSKALSGELTTVRLTTAGGTAVGDSGSVNIQYENPDLAVSGIESVAAGVTDVFVNGTKQASTSGSTKDFTIPSGVKEIKITFDGYSTSSTTETLLQLGDAGGIEATGYVGGASNYVAHLNATTGFTFYNESAGAIMSGCITLTLHDAASNTWVCSGQYDDTVGAQTVSIAGSKSLTGELTTVRINAGADTMDAGSINVQYDNQELDLGSGVISGGVVQTVNTQNGEHSTTTTAMPADDSIPQNTEGAEFMTASITPTNVANKLKIEVVFNLSLSGLDRGVVALFQDSTADALAAVGEYASTAVGEFQLILHHWMDAGTTDSTTFKVRAGKGGAGTLEFNGRSGNRRYAGRNASSITVTEYAA